MNDHLATWAAEVAISDEEQSWYAWIAEAQRIAGHNLDGDEREDGYCLDMAYQAWRDGKTPRDYILTIPAAALILGGNPELSEFVQRESIADAAEMRERLAIQADAENERDGHRD